jgi:hypothetical protein
VSSIEAVVDLWKREGVQLRPPGDGAKLRAVFQSIGVPLSCDVARLYSLTDGFADTMDVRLFTLWTPGVIAIRNPPGTPEPSFADHSIECFHYRLRYESPDHSSVHGGFDDHMIAPSLESFFTLFLCADEDADLRLL